MTGQVTTIRWLVRLETVRRARFGDRARATVMWTVRAYMPLDNSFKAFLHPSLTPACFHTLDAAIAHARKLCAQRYGNAPVRSQRSTR